MFKNESKPKNKGNANETSEEDILLFYVTIYMISQSNVLSWLIG